MTWGPNVTPERYEERLAILSRLRMARLEAGMSQTAAGERLGMRRDVIAKIETGLRTPAPEVVAAMCRIYGADPRHVLLGGTTTKENDDGKA